METNNSESLESSTGTTNNNTIGNNGSFTPKPKPKNKSTKSYGYSNAVWRSTGNTASEKLTGRPRIWTDELLQEVGDDLIKWLMAADENLFFEEFLLMQGLYRDLVGRYVEHNSSFAEQIKIAKAIQEVKLAKGGLLGVYRDAPTIFLLKNYHNMTDKQESFITNAQPVNIQIVLPELPEGKTPTPIDYNIITPVELQRNPDKVELPLSASTQG